MSRSYINDFAYCFGLILILGNYGLRDLLQAGIFGYLFFGIGQAQLLLVERLALGFQPGELASMRRKQRIYSIGADQKSYE